MKKNLEKIIKFLKKKRKGFTLVELLGAIVILGILSTIAILSLTKVLESSHKKYYDTQVKLFQAAGQTYFSDHKDLLPTINFGINQVDLGTLIDQGYINEIVDYNKEECYKDKSYVTVTRRGPSSYVYQAFLSCKNRKAQTYVDGKDSTAGIDLQYGTIDSNNGNLIGSIYYVRGTLNLNLNITASNSIGDNSGVTGYSYTLIKVNQNNSKKDYKTSEIIPSDANSICTEYSGDKCRKITDTIKIRAKDIKDGKYIIKINAYNLVGKDNSKTFDIYTILIDKTKPKCSITLPTKTNENFVNGWYNGKASNGSIAFTDAYLSNYDITNNSNPTYNNSISGTSGTRTITLKDTTTSGQTFYGYVKDKAGNVGTCKTDVIKVDKSSPTCGTKNSGGVVGENGWYKYGTDYSNPVRVTATCKDGDVNNSSGCVEQSKAIGTYYDNYQGLVATDIYDNAGNKNICQTNIKIDVEVPTCSINFNGTAGANGWYTSNTSASLSVSENYSGEAARGLAFGGWPGYNNLSSVGPYGNGTSNLIYGQVKDKAGNSNSCTKYLQIDTVAPTCEVNEECYVTDGSGNWCDVTGGYAYVSKCDDTASGCANYSTLTTSGATTNVTNEIRTGDLQFSRDVKAGGKSSVTFTLYDYAGNPKQCPTQTVLVDKVGPVITSDSLCTTTENRSCKCPNDNNKVYKYVLTYTVVDYADKDNNYIGSGYTDGSFTWPNGESDPEYGKKVKSKHWICSSTKSGSYTYTLYDAVGNSKSGSRKMDGSS